MDNFEFDFEKSMQDISDKLIEVAYKEFREKLKETPNINDQIEELIANQRDVAINFTKELLKQYHKSLLLYLSHEK